MFFSQHSLFLSTLTHFYDSKGNVLIQNQPSLFQTQESGACGYFMQAQTTPLLAAKILKFLNSAKNNMAYNFIEDTCASI